MHKRGKNFFCSFSSCKYANWCNFQALPLPNLINRSWRHRIVSDFLLLLLLLYIISLAFKIEHCEFEDLLGIFLLSKYLAHSGRMVQYTKKGVVQSVDSVHVQSSESITGNWIFLNFRVLVRRDCRSWRGGDDQLKGNRIQLFLWLMTPSCGIIVPYFYGQDDSRWARRGKWYITRGKERESTVYSH